jgi:hypothetical protein
MATSTRTAKRTDERASEAEGGSDALASFDPTDAMEKISDFARENPHAALAGAAALGFLLGGGLTPRLLATVGMFAGRRYLNRAMRDGLEGVLRAELGGR